MSVSKLYYNGREIKISEHHGRKYVFAQDLCAVLERSIGSAYSSFPENTRDVVYAESKRGVRKFLVVDQQGVYSLLVRSRKSLAEPFFNWLSSTVYPTLRSNDFPLPLNGSVEKNEPEECDTTEKYPVAFQKNQAVSGVSIVNVLETLLVMAKQQERIEQTQNQHGVEIEKAKKIALEAKQIAEHILETTRIQNSYTTVSAYAKKLKVFVSAERAKTIGLTLRKYCLSQGIDFPKVNHPKYPQGVNTYPLAVLQTHKHMFATLSVLEKQKSLFD